MGDSLSAPQAGILGDVPHASTRLSGHGLVLVPRAGYRIERVADAPETTLRIAQAAESAVVDVAAAAHAEAPSELADISPGARTGHWRVETSLLTCLWPHGFALVDDPDGVSPFLLVGPDDAMIWVSSPIASERATPIEKLADDGQTVRAVAQADDNSRIDLDYTIDDEAWWQRRYVLVWASGQVLVVSAQARREGELVARAAVDAVAQSVTHAVAEPSASDPTH